MKAFSSRNGRTFRLYGLLLLCLLALVLIADLNAERILLLSLKYPGIDKIGHFFIHLMLVGCLYILGRFLWRQLGVRYCLLGAFVLSFTLGVMDEFHQLQIDGRDSDPFDVLANLCGSLTAVVLIGARTIDRRLVVPLLLIPLLGIFLLVAHSQNSRLYYNTGLLHVKQKNYLAARKAFLLAVEHGEDLPGLYNELAWLELEHLKVDPAIPLERTARAIAARPDNADFQDTHGWALYMNKRYQEALSYLRSAYQSNAEGYCINYHLAAVYHALNMNRQAVFHLHAQLALNNTDRFAEKSLQLLQLINRRP